jgi:hypothetical protein
MVEGVLHMTIQNLIDAIAEALFQEFGSGYEIHTEKVEQGLTEPCFFIRCLNPTMNVSLGRCYKRTNQFSIQYIPSTQEPIAECISVMERLFGCLENVILHGKPLHGRELNGEITDGILTFTVNYDGFVLRHDEPIPDMDDLGILAEVKG